MVKEATTPTPSLLDGITANTDSGGRYGFEVRVFVIQRTRFERCLDAVQIRLHDAGVILGEPRAQGY